MIMDKTKKRKQDLLTVFALVIMLGLSCLVIFKDYLLGNQLLVFNDIGSDTWQQYIMNYTSIVNHLRAGDFSLWDFSNGLGINMFNFNLFDPFLMLLYGAGFWCAERACTYADFHQYHSGAEDPGSWARFLLVSFSVSVQSSGKAGSILCVWAERIPFGVGTALSIWHSCSLSAFTFYVL